VIYAAGEKNVGQLSDIPDDNIDENADKNAGEDDDNVIYAAGEKMPGS
jgi:hypothetical protein